MFIQQLLADYKNNDDSQDHYDDYFKMLDTHTNFLIFLKI
jgi:hypothetical protein